MARSFTQEVEIARLGGQGDGVADTPRGRLYVPYTVPGDRVGVRVGKPAGDGRAAEMIELLCAGASRVEPPCPHYHDCGGCVLQHVADGAYTAWKRDLVVSALARHGLADVEVLPLQRVAAGDRRRADLVGRKVGGRVLLGYHRLMSKRIVDIGACLVLDPRLVALIAPLRALLDGLLASGAALNASMTVTESGIDLLLEGLQSIGLEQREALARFADVQDLARLSVREARQRQAETIVKRRAPVVRFGNVAVEPPPDAFLQASPAAEAVMLAAVSAAMQGRRRIADLFAGLGTFALPLSAGADVLAVEDDAALTAALQTAANRAGRDVKVERRNLQRNPMTADELARFDAVTFDPPRAGAKEQAAALAQSRVPLVAGVSCAPGSFARDAKLLAAGGYRLERVLPVDQFVWTAHVELVGVFRR
ncbi:MAG TPA: hypothetical protein VEU47_11245 [Candidatus Cybelea sp.]|nr:hypothetical protein [Candidatus Cybelea sp.]